MPKISVISPSFNTGQFIVETLDSIQQQSFTDYEHIIVDGGSTDGTLEVLKKHPKIVWISEPDNGYPDAFRKGVTMAKGEYIINCGISDGFLDYDWFRRCVAILDAQPNISLVWGLPQTMTEDGKLGEISYKKFLTHSPAQREEFFYSWLVNYFWFPEGNLCIRKSVLEKCLPVIKQDRGGDRDMWLEFNYLFHRQGYLSFFLPVVASYGRWHEGARGEEEARSGILETRLLNYKKEVSGYRRQLLLGRVSHVFQNGHSQPLLVRFSRWRLWGMWLAPASLEKRFMGWARITVKQFLRVLIVRKYLPLAIRKKLAYRLRLEP